MLGFGTLGSQGISSSVLTSLSTAQALQLHVLCCLLPHSWCFKPFFM